MTLLPPLERASPARHPELMDRHDCDAAVLSRALDALARANRLFGGRRLLWSGLRSVLEDAKPGPIRLLDVGAGGGDMAAELHRRLSARGWSPSFVLADLHPRTLRLARERLSAELPADALGRFRFVRLNAPELPFAGDSFDVAFSSTMLHHLERREAVAFLRELPRVSRRGWAVTDLRRSRITWWAVRLLAATLWRNNPLPRRDGPVSVRRAFTPGEARELLDEADVSARVGGGRPFRLRLRSAIGAPGAADAPGAEAAPGARADPRRTARSSPDPSARRTTESDPEVLVVGAGPAGSSLALRLARRGIEVRLLDARSFPRSKPCGDCLSPGATPLLRELGVLDAVAAKADRLRGWRMRAPNGVWFEGRFGGTEDGGAGTVGSGGGTPSGLALSREELDTVLLDAARRAGVEVRERTRVFDLSRRGDRVTGVRARGADGDEISIRARVVVGADGLRSVVARRLDGVRRGDRERLAVVGRFHARGSGSAAANGSAADGASLGHMRISADGCLGIAPVGGGLRNVTLVVPFDRAGAISEDRRAFYFERVRSYGEASLPSPDRLHGELEITGPFRFTPRRRTAPGALLIGDAAGYFDPFTGQGIYRALASARLAADLIPEWLSDGSGSGKARVPERFERGMDELLGASRRLQRWIDAVVRRPALINPLARLLASRPALASLLVDVTGDLLPPRAAGDPVRLGRALFTRQETHAYS